METTTTTQTRKHKLYRLIASTVAARQNCWRVGNYEWVEKHTTLLHLLEDLLPSGSGVDSGTAIDGMKSGENRLVLYTSFHHKDESGGDDGWTKHTITVKPSLSRELRITVSGENRNEIKEYLADLFEHTLTQEVVETYDVNTNEKKVRVAPEPTQI